MKIYILTKDQLRKAIELARLIQEDGSAYDSFSVEDISGCTEVCTYGWGEKYSDDEIIDSITPMEIPSDEDIEMQKPFGDITEPSSHFGFQGWIKGAKWFKRLIFNQIGNHKL